MFKKNKMNFFGILCGFQKGLRLELIKTIKINKIKIITLKQ